MDESLQEPADCPTAVPMEMQISEEIYTDALCTDIMQSYEMMNSLYSPADRLLHFKPLHVKIKTLRYEALTQEQRIALATILFTTAMHAFDNNYLQLVPLYYLDAINVLTKDMQNLYKKDMLQPLLRFFKAAFKISHIPATTMAKIEGLIKQVGSSAPECGLSVPCI